MHSNEFMTNIEISASQLSYDKEKIYNFAKAYNEWFETIIKTGDTECMGGLREENELPDLVFDILSYEEYVLFVPRKAKYFHVINKLTREEKIFDKADISDKYEINDISFFSFCWNKCAYCVYRGRPIVVKYEFETDKWEVCNDEYAEDMIDAIAYSYKGDQIALLSSKETSVYIFTANKNELYRLKLDDKAGKCCSISLVNGGVWLFSNEKDKIYFYDKTGKLETTLSLKYKDKHVIPRLFQEDGRLNAYSNIGNEYVRINLKSLYDEKLLFDEIPQRYWFNRTKNFVYGICANNRKRLTIGMMVELNECDQSLRRIIPVFGKSFSKEDILKKIEEAMVNYIKANIERDSCLIWEDNGLLLKDYIKYCDSLT